MADAQLTLVSTPSQKKSRTKTASVSEDPTDLDEISLVRTLSALHDEAVISAQSDCGAGGVSASPMSDARERMREPASDDAQSTVLVLIYREDELTQVNSKGLCLAVPPTKANGWRSQMNLDTNTGRRLSAELVAAPPNMRPAADFSSQEVPAVERTRDAMRAFALHQLGKAEWRYGQDESELPIRTHIIQTNRDCDPDGRVHLWSIVQLFRTCESVIQQNNAGDACQHVRRVHLYSRIAPGTEIGVWTRRYLGAPHAPASQSLRSYARRLCDGEVMAFCDTTLR